MRNIFFYLFASSFFFLACESETPSIEFKDSSSFDVFHVNIGQDTTLVTQNGVKFKISKNTFSTTESSIQLMVHTFTDKFSMVQNNLSTLTTDGQLLESDGMFHIESLPKVEINHNAPIQVSFPTNSFTFNMKIFKGKMKDGFYVWDEIDTLQPNATTKAIEQGKNIFMTHCTSCHNSKLALDMTGPALGNITHFRDSAFLVDFTRNSQGMIRSGDTLANCIYYQWNGGAMNSFPFLSDKEIWSIYQFINSESRNQNIALDSIKYIQECEYIDWETRRIQDSINVSNFFRQLEENIKQNQKAANQLFGYYEFNISSFGIHNVDMYGASTEETIDNFKFKFKNTNSDSIIAYAIIKDRNAILDFGQIQYREMSHLCSLYYNILQIVHSFSTTARLIFAFFCGL